MGSQPDGRDEPGARRGVTLALKIVPGASRTGIAGWMGERLKLRVTAVAERGRANAAVIEALAAALDVPVSAIRLLSGSGSARKVVEIRGRSRADVLARLPERHRAPARKGR